MSVKVQLKKELDKKDNIIGHRVKKSINNKIKKYEDEKKKKATTKKARTVKKEKIEKAEKVIKQDLKLLKSIKKDKYDNKKVKTRQQIAERAEDQRVMEKLRSRLERYDDRIDNHILKQSTVHPGLYDGMTIDEIKFDTDTLYVHNNFRKIIKRMHDELYKDNLIDRAYISAFYGASRPDEYDAKTHEMVEYPVEFAYTTSERFDRDTDPLDINFTVESRESGLKYVLLGFKIYYETNKRITKKRIREWKAYYPMSDSRKYHDLTHASTSDNGICIYETFLDIMGKIKLKNMRKTEKRKIELMKMLESEGDEIKNNVIDGNLIKSLELLTIKYDTDVVITIFNSDEKSLIIAKGDTSEIDDIKEHYGTKGMLYAKDLHVAPWIIKEYEKPSIKENNNKKSTYKLRPEYLKVDLEKNKITDILDFDYEVIKDDKGVCTVSCACLYGMLDGKEIKVSFYGEDSLTKFVEYLESISTPMYNEKKHANDKIKRIQLYGFNCSRFDNLFLYDKLHDINPKMEFNFKKNNIKMMQFNNVRILDVSLYYSGKLEKVAEDFKLEQKKGCFPYKFPNKDNLNYVGAIPDKKYFNKESDYKECKKQLNGEQFDLKKYTIEYCMNDAKLAYEITLKHLASCTGIIRKRKFDVQRCPTSSAAAKKIYSQCFQDEDLNGSPEEQIEHETESYKGGYVGPFMKYFKSSGKNRLYAYDRCASYLAEMREQMPKEFRFSVRWNPDKIADTNKIVESNNYCASVKYVGNNKRYIPNIIVRDQDTKLVNGFLETEFVWVWGVELIEAILAGCEVRIKKEDVYTKSALFKEFAEYFYNKRLEAKKENNSSLEKFFKEIGCSLYGKFGQSAQLRKKIVNGTAELFSILKEEKGKLVSDVMLDSGKIIIEYEVESDNDNRIGKLVRFSSYISARARTCLFRTMRENGYEYQFYADTDSIFTTKPLDENLVTRTAELGKWKIVGEPIVEASFIAPKTYYTKDENDVNLFKAKGIDSSQMTEDDYKKLLDGETYTQKRDNFFRSLQKVRILEISKTIKGTYDKRIWNDNESYPFRNMQEWKEYKNKIKIEEE